MTDHSPQFENAYGNQIDALLEIAYCENPSADHIRELLEEVAVWAEKHNLHVLAEAMSEALPIFEKALTTEVDNAEFMGRIQKQAQRVVEHYQKGNKRND